MWFSLDDGPGDGEAVASVLPRLEAVLRFAQDLQAQLSAVGLDGIAGAIELSRRLRALLDPIPAAELTRMIAEVDSLSRAIAQIGRTLDEIRRLKAML